MEGAVKVEITEDLPTPSDPDEQQKQLAAAAKAIAADAALAAQLKIKCLGDPATVIQSYLLAHGGTWPTPEKPLAKLLFSGVLRAPPRGNLVQRVELDAATGEYDTNIDVADGRRVEGWAYNVASNGSQHLAITQGSMVVQASGVGPLILYALGQSGSPFTVTASTLTQAPAALSPPAPAPSSASSSASAASATSALPSAVDLAAAAAAVAAVANKTDPVAIAAAAAQAARATADATAGSPAVSACLAAPNVLGLLDQAFADALKSGSLKSRYTALATYATVAGNYNYAVEVRDGSGVVNASTAVPNGNVSVASDVASSAPTVAAEHFRSHLPHRKASVTVEEAFNFAGSLATSGYAYATVAQTGPDQLYQLQSASHAADNFTLSASVVIYPYAVVGGNSQGCIHSAGQHADLLRGMCFSRIGVSFGPTFLRGTNSEVFKQWNLRVGYELMPDVLLTLGPSWRTIDAPLTPVGTLVSVPRPATTPVAPTASMTDTVLSLGLSVDLAILTDGVAAISNAVSSKGASK